MKNITVFGGSNPTPSDYEQAVHLGLRLGKAGFNVLTGGYIGTMEAVSKGASKSGVDVIGVTCDQIEAWRPVKPNAWVMKELRYPTILERLYVLIEQCDAAIALPGGPGTLAEISLLWNHLLIRALPSKPLILIGAGWKATFDTFFAELDAYTPVEQRKWLNFEPDVDGAVDLLLELKDSKQV